MQEYRLVVDGVSKCFRLPHERHVSLKARMLDLRRQTFEKLEVLRDVSFKVRDGEFFGITGRNGSGKSTLLKLISGIYSPTSGTVRLNGSLTPFIELGVGFNMELSGRDNVFLNAAIFGLTTAATRELYGSIVEFAELERFMDQKLKNYSSGMSVRLAFSIARHAQNEILLIDEVLAVGDAGFQQKCLNEFERVKAEGRTVIFVSHDMQVIQSFCDRAILIEEGQITVEGSGPEVVDAYHEVVGVTDLERG